MEKRMKVYNALLVKNTYMLPPPSKGCSQLNENHIKSNNGSSWECSICSNKNKNGTSDNLHLYPDYSFAHLIKSCENVRISSDENDDPVSEIYNQISSKYYNIDDLNNIVCDEASSLGLLHINLASLYKHYDELVLSLSMLRKQPHVIAVSEHKINDPILQLNIDIPGYHEFIFDSSLTSHGDTYWRLYQ